MMDFISNPFAAASIAFVFGIILTVWFRKHVYEPWGNVKDDYVKAYVWLVSIITTCRTPDEVFAKLDEYGYPVEDAKVEVITSAWSGVMPSALKVILEKDGTAEWLVVEAPTPLATDFQKSEYSILHSRVNQGGMSSTN